jgi:hypothetical protein
MPKFVPSKTTQCWPFAWPVHCSLTAKAQARLLTYRNEYTFDGVEYAPLMYKIIMRLATINSIATTQTLC